MAEKIIIAIKIFICISCTHIFAQDLRSGEITYRFISGNMYEAHLDLYQDPSTYINRNIILHWGDGALDTLHGAAGWCNGVIVSKYAGIHTYLNSGTYQISSSDSFLIANISNINSSWNKKLPLGATLIINPFLGTNSSPILGNCQDVKWSCCGWVHNPGATDADGDSLSYIVVPWNTSNYSFPSETVDSITGDFHLFPSVIGIYAVAIKIDEWRKINTQYYNIGSITRYMLLNVDSLASINENNFSTQLNIYPNPTHSELNISASDNKKYTAIIKNILGQTLMEKKFVGNISFDVSNLAKGMLFVELRDEKGRICTEKLVVE